MKFTEFSEILSKLSLVTRLKFRSTDGWTIFSVIRSFEGWILIDGTGGINFRFTEFDADPADREIVNLRFWSGILNEKDHHIGSVYIKSIEGVDFV